MAARQRSSRTGQPPLLSPAAEQLYTELISQDDVPRSEVNDHLSLTELLDTGLVDEPAPDLVRVASPAAALGRLLLRRQRQYVEAQQRLLDDYERLFRLAGPAQPTATSDEFEMLYTVERVAAVALELQSTASQCWRMLAMRPETPVPQGVSGRLILTPDMLPAVDGADCRLIERAPLRMQVIDDTALVLLASDDAGAAVAVRERVIVAALVDYFDLLWAKAVPVPQVSEGDDGTGLTSLQHAIVVLLGQGMTDETIARALAMSTRSVRRHVAGLEERAGVTSRFALGAAATRLGWIDTQSLAG